MMLFKLSIKNIRKSFKDYAIYFLTLVLGVAIFYVFNAIDSQEAMLTLTSAEKEIINLMNEFLSGVSVFVAIILGFLIIYASRFLIKRRKKEFGIYLTLGMSKKNVSKILLLETFIIGVHLEGSFLSKEKSGIQDKKVFKIPSITNFKELVGKYEKIIKIVTIAPENDIDLIDYLNEKNIITQAGHSISESLKNCKGTTHHFNAMNPIHHRTPSITLEALINDNIYCEFIADLIHTNLDIVKLILKTKPKDKIILISDSLPISHFDKEIIFCNKKIFPQGKDENGTLAGSIKTLDEICHNLIKEKIITKEEIKKMAFENQIKYLNLTDSEVDILNR